MSKNVTVAACHPKVIKTTKSGNAIFMSETSIASAACADNSGANRKRLENWSEKKDYKNITFWIPPSVIATTDQCISEVGKAVIHFDQMKAAGNITPVEEKTENNL
jgi:hypothetical protein